MELIIKGKSNKDVAEILGKSPPVVAGFLRLIYAKLDAHNRAEASANFVKRQK